VCSPLAGAITGGPKRARESQPAAYFERGLQKYPELHFELVDTFLGHSSVTLIFRGAAASSWQRSYSSTPIEDRTRVRTFSSRALRRVNLEQVRRALRRDTTHELACTLESDDIAVMCAK
jgi:hypothetical protein